MLQTFFSLISLFAHLNFSLINHRSLLKLKYVVRVEIIQVFCVVCWGMYKEKKHGYVYL